MKYDLIIIGAGPAGLTAGIYAARYNLKTLIISKDMGGFAANAHKICNFPSYTEITGMELIQKVVKQAESLGVKINYNEVLDIEGKNNNFVVKTNKTKYNTKKVIYSGGTIRRKLNIPGEEKFLGKGVSYCATCDAGFFKDKVIGVVGGSDSALTTALLLSRYGTKVYIIYRQKNFFRAEPEWVKQVKSTKNIKPLFSKEIKKITGSAKLESVQFKSGESLKLDGLFIEIGSSPDIKTITAGKINQNKKGYIITDREQKTNIQGLYAAGDITDNNLKQIITACSQGAVASYNIYNELNKNE